MLKLPSISRLLTKPQAYTDSKLHRSPTDTSYSLNPDFMMLVYIYKYKSFWLWLNYYELNWIGFSHAFTLLRNILKFAYIPS